MHNVGVVSLKFYWGKMRSTAQGTASQTVPRSCFEQVVRKVNIYVIFGEGKYMQSSLYFLQVSASHKE